MALVLRKITKSRWYREHADLPWLQPGEVPSDSLADLKTQDNALSLWLIEDESNIDRVLAAISTRSTNLSNTDYRLLDLNMLVAQGFELQKNPGVTADQSANGWHRDLVELSAGRLIEFAEQLQNWPDVTYRRTETQIRRLILEGVLAGNIDPSRMTISTDDKLWQMLGDL